MSTREISAAAQALGRRGGLKSLGAKSKAELSAFGKAAAEKRWKKAKTAEGRPLTEAPPLIQEIAAAIAPVVFSVHVAPKPKRPLPKAGTMAARVLDVLGKNSMAPVDSSFIAAFLSDEDPAKIQNALSSLRSAGHVVSEPKLWSRREKLWRLAFA